MPESLPTPEEALAAVEWAEQSGFRVVAKGSGIVAVRAAFEGHAETLRIHAQVVRTTYGGRAEPTGVCRCGKTWRSCPDALNALRSLEPLVEAHREATK